MCSFRRPNVTRPDSKQVQNRILRAQETAVDFCQRPAQAEYCSPRANTGAIQRPAKLFRLLETPVRLRIFSRRGQLPGLAAIGQHAPDLNFSGAVGLKHDVPPIRRPARKIVAPTIMRKLRPLFAGDIHHIDIAGARRSRPIMPHPGEGEKLSIRATTKATPRIPDR